MIELPSQIKAELRERLTEARRKYPEALSDDGNSLMVAGGIGYGAFMNPEGDIYLETYELSDDSQANTDRSVEAQIKVIVLGSTNLPILLDLLPKRPPEAPTCNQCVDGWNSSVQIICDECSGLGWLFPDQFSWP